MSYTYKLITFHDLTCSKNLFRPTFVDVGGWSCFGFSVHLWNLCFSNFLFIKRRSTQFNFIISSVGCNATCMILWKIHFVVEERILANISLLRKIKLKCIDWEFSYLRSYLLCLGSTFWHLMPLTYQTMTSFSFPQVLGALKRLPFFCRSCSNRYFLHRS